MYSNENGNLKPGLKLRQFLRQKTALRQIAVASFFAALLTVLFIVLFNVGDHEEAKAVTVSETLTSGSFIVNMGITPQTVNNGMKPYGLVYDLIANYNVPVKWIIDPAKTKDGTDFIYNSTNYSGGPFIIQSEFINATISARIAYWQTLGVQGTYTTSDITVPVYTTLTSYPYVLIDNLSGNDSIIIKYYDNTGIPPDAYDIGAPADLNACHDLWVNPHGDPVWASHQYLYNFVVVQKSYIWSECHAVSMLEGCRNPVAPFEQLNYLSGNGLMCWKTNGIGPPACGPTITQNHVKSALAPFSYYYPTDPVMQFMGTIYSPTSSGSEQWFRPQTTAGGGWRPATRRLVTTATGVSPYEGVLMVYGYGYGDPANGMVMYTGGHDLNTGTTAEAVAAQRAFLNFSLLAGKAKELLFSSSFIPSTFNSGQVLDVSVTVTSGLPPYTYQWTSTIGGTFANPDSAATTFQAPYFVSNTQGVIQCIVTDACGRKNFISQFITVNAGPLPVTLLSFRAEPVNDNSVLISWSTASETNNDYFTVERSKNGAHFSELTRVKGAGSSSTSRTYSCTDDHPYTGTSYYRLRQTDFNGRYEIFKAVTVSLKDKYSTAATPRISPNPFEESFTAQFESLKKETVTVELINTEGKIIYSEKILTATGTNLFRYKPQSLPKAGTYILKISSSSEVLGSSKVICGKPLNSKQ